ncbi:peroxide stress protein YaaA [Streptacidiphilus anmyonensis]|uniref:peroxide stress protein YaaA n=1 Tax=Streptacidiphilus anmyonensis TaxID=405782 RepID=UPI0005A7E048|nr:peroxide stress protein YaaA [Streptacidiphilus anmyonensis]
MLVLLPPSEGKAATGEGAPLDLGSLVLPGLTGAREAVLDALVALCREDEGTALEVLGIGEGLRGELARNAELRTAAALPAGGLYTGVLYDNLGLAELAPSARARAEESIVVFSGLWGVVRITDRIPPYRCSGGTKLPRLGGLAAHWRKPMAAAMPELAGDGLVLDLRSSAYAALWKPTGEVASRTATVRVLHERVVNGVTKRSVVSHFNKATKGRLLRQLLESGAEPGSPAELVDALRDAKFTVETQAPTAGKPWALDVVVAEL